MKVTICLGAVALLALAEPAFGQSCTAFPVTLTNGTTANASDVMRDFTYLGNYGCLAPSANPGFTGNVGIGTTSPGSMLSIYGGVTASLDLGSNGPTKDLDLYTDGAGNGYIMANATGGGYRNLFLGNSSTVRMTIASATGYVGVGTTTPAQSLSVTGNNGQASPGYTANFSSGLGAGTAVGNQVDVTNSTSSWGELLGFDGSGVAASAYHGPYYAYVVNVQNAPLVLGTNNAAVMTITGAGSVGIGLASPSYMLQVNGTAGGTGAWQYPSDQRLKKNIHPIENALAMVQRMQGVRFNWRTPDERAVGKSLNLPVSDPQVGVIAQDLERVLPEAVMTGNYPDKIKNVAESKIVPVLIEAVKELKQENDDLRARDRGRSAKLEGVEQRLAALEAKIAVHVDNRYSARRSKPYVRQTGNISRHARIANVRAVE